MPSSPAPKPPSSVGVNVALSNNIATAGPRIDDWNLLRSFIAIYETGTLTDAAKRLGMTQPNMGRHLRHLETLLGEPLFVRLPSKLKANAQADALYAASVPMHQAARDAARLFTDQAQRVAGVVRLVGVRGLRLPRGAAAVGALVAGRSRTGN
jgi:DNA-binding transcriptional LysR family regulator